MENLKSLIKAVLAKCGKIYRFHEDEELVNIYVQTEDECAFEQLFERHLDSVYAIVYRILRNSHDTEDVVQDIFVTLSQKLSGFRKESSFTTWLFRISTNAALMKIRNNRKLSNNYTFEDSRNYEEIKETGNTYLHNTGNQRPDHKALRKEKAQILEEAIQQLPESYRIVIHLRDIEGMTYDEISKILDISLQAVKSRIHRARMVLRTKLSYYFN